MTDRVIIAGAGPTGLAAALFLTAQGIPVTVLEREARLPEDMRASTFHPPTLDMLAPSGLAAEIARQGHRAERWQYVRMDTRDVAVFDLGVLADLTAHPYRLQCEQFRLTRAILERLGGDPSFDFAFDAAVASFEETPTGVRVLAETAGRRATLDGRYLIGADGAHSTVRRLLGLDLKGDTYPVTSITVGIDLPADLLDRMLAVNYVWTRDDHFSLMRVADHWRMGSAPAPGETVEAALSDAGIRGRLARLLPGAERCPLRHRGAYTVHRRVADTFRVGRVLLAGDAAHLNSPSGGMGMNSGIHDARDLADQLARVMAGSDPALLDGYVRRRRAVAVEDVQARSDASYRRHRERDPAKREGIWSELKAIAADRERMREFLLGSSMIASVHRAAALS